MLDYMNKPGWCAENAKLLSAAAAVAVALGASPALASVDPGGVGQYPVKNPGGVGQYKHHSNRSILKD